MTAASGKADGGAELLREALVALRAQRTMDDRGPQPRKFDEALSWRENDIKARALVDDAIIHITAHLATPAANGPGEADGWVAVSPETMPTGHRMLLVTNNINARDAHGEMSHLWLVRMIHPPGDEPYYTAYTEDMTLLHGITHYRYALASTPQPGMVTVPREPTEAMLDAAIAWRIALKVTDSYSMRDQFADCYRAMLDAALRSGEMGR